MQHTALTLTVSQQQANSSVKHYLLLPLIVPMVAFSNWQAVCNVAESYTWHASFKRCARPTSCLSC